MTVTTLTRRAALTGAVASIAAVGTVAGATTVHGLNPHLTELLASYHAANAAWDDHCRNVTEPAEDLLAAGKAAAEAVNPHVTMTIDMSWYSTENPTRTLTTADQMDVRSAAYSAGYKFEPAELWTDDQHRHFADLRQFNEARIQRDAKIAVAVQEARRTSGIDAAQAAENDLWDIAAAARSAVVQARPRSLADLTAKLAFYAQTHAIDGQDDLLSQITSDVDAITSGRSHLAQMEG